MIREYEDSDAEEGSALIAEHSPTPRRQRDMPADNPETNVPLDASGWTRRSGAPTSGTARAYRRRGLARLAKLAVVRGCAEAGISRLMTENDSENVGMLAINDELGFKHFAVMTEWVKQDA